MSDLSLVEMGRQIAQDDEALQRNLAQYNARDLDPRRQAEAITVAKENNLPVDTTYRNLDGLRKRKPDINWEQLDKDAPSLKKALEKNPEMMSVAQMEVNELSNVERVFRSIGQAFTQTTGAFEESYLWGRDMDGIATPEDMQRLEQFDKDRKKEPNYFGTYDPWNIPAQATGAVTSTVIPLIRSWDEVLQGMFAGGVIGASAGPGVVPGIITGGAWGANLGFLKENFQFHRGDIWGEARTTLDENGEPLGRDVSYALAVGGAAINTGLERVGFGVISKAVPGLDKIFGKGAKELIGLAAKNPAVRKSFDRIGKILRAGATESATELAQEVTKLELIMAAGGVTDEEGNSLADTRMERYPAAAYGGLVGGTAIAGGGQAVDAGITTFKSARAKAKGESFRDLGRALKSSEVAKMSPETMQAFAETLDEDSTTVMEVPAEAVQRLFQRAQGLVDDGEETGEFIGFVSPEQLQLDFPELMEQLNDAEATGADLNLSAKDFIKIAQMEGFDEFSQDIRSAEGEITEREAIALEEEMQTVQEQVEQGELELQPEAFDLRDNIEQKLVAEGIDPTAAATQATVFAAT